MKTLNLKILEEPTNLFLSGWVKFSKWKNTAFGSLQKDLKTSH